MSSRVEYLPKADPRFSFCPDEAVGRGGYCSVSPVLEFDSRPRIDLVVKRLRREGVPPLGREKMREEIRLLGRLRGSPYVPRVFLSGSFDDRPWYVMEKLSPLGAGDCREIQRVLDIITGIASALGYIHGYGIAHRDLKLDNIFLRSDGTVVLGDFGIAVSSDTSDVIFNYWCPTGRRYDVPDEMLRITAELGMPVEEKIRILQSSDVYMFGYRIYELLTGETLNNPECDFAVFRSSVNAFFGYDVGDYALAFLFRAVSEATERDCRRRCPLEAVVRYVSTARTAVDGRRLTPSDIADGSAVIGRAVLHSRVDNADCAVFSSPEDIDAFLRPVMRNSVLVHNGREIEFSDIEIENGTVTMLIGLRKIRFAIAKLTFYNLRENHHLFRIETKCIDCDGDIGAGFRSHLQDILSRGGEVLTVLICGESLLRSQREFYRAEWIWST